MILIQFPINRKKMKSKIKSQNPTSSRVKNSRRHKAMSSSLFGPPKAPYSSSDHSISFLSSFSHSSTTFSSSFSSSSG